MLPILLVQRWVYFVQHLLFISILEAPQLLNCVVKLCKHLHFYEKSVLSGNQKFDTQEICHWNMSNPSVGFWTGPMCLWISAAAIHFATPNLQNKYPNRSKAWGKKCVFTQWVNKETRHLMKDLVIMRTLKLGV